MNNKENGFTLIEILVVVSILGVLMGLVSYLVVTARRKGDQFQADGAMTNLNSMIEKYVQEFKRPPGMTVAELKRMKAYEGLQIDNNVNENSECLLVAMRHPDLTTPFSESDFGYEGALGNTDEDSWNQAPKGTADPMAYEICDPWGNPLVYIHKNNYGKPVTVRNAAGLDIEVNAVRKADGTWYNPTKWQIICLGENGVQDEDGEMGDDRVNFMRTSGSQ